MPRWGYDGWLHDYDRSGDVAMDMHIHDMDMIRFMFGEPKVVSALSNDARTKCTTIHSRFHYDDKLVFAIGDWGQGKTKKFSFKQRINLEQATIEMSDEGIKVFPDEGEPYELAPPQKQAIWQRNRCFLPVRSWANWRTPRIRQKALPKLCN